MGKSKTETPGAEAPLPAPRKGRAQVLTWVVIGAGVPDLKIRARSFDEALEKARLRDSQYCGGYVADDE